MATTRIPQEWRHEQRDLDEVIPKAITLFHETSNHQEKIDVLTFLCDGLLPKLSLLSLEETLLCYVFPELPLYVDKILLEINDVVQLENELDQNNSTNKPQLIHDLLLVVLTVLQCVETCVRHIYETFQSISIQQVNSLPVSVLLIAKSSFSHCQRSEESYGELFSYVSQDLSLLFRKSFELQKLLLELMCVKIEALSTTNSEKDLQNITSVCEHLLDICAITEQFDGNMTPGMWKSLIRLVMKNRESIKNHLQSDRLVSQMCSTLEEKLHSYENLINNKNNTTQDSISETLSAKLSKVLKFFMKLLTSFLQSFQDFLLENTFKDVIGLIFSIIRVSYTSLTKQSSGLASDSLIIVVEPFLKIMVLNKKFADLLTRLDQEIHPKENLLRCYTLANIVVLLPLVPEEISLYWIKPENYTEYEPRVSVYEALLDSCDTCFVEMSLPFQLPGKMCNGNPQRMISFYEYVVSRLSASLSAIPSQHFHIIEKILLKSVFDSGMISCTIAIDVWCFLARWMTADVCYNHVKLFLHWLRNLSWKSDLQKNRMCLLVRRLLPLLAQEHQELLVQEYPPGSHDNMDIWFTVPLHKMIESVRIQASQTIVHLSITSLQLWLDKSLSHSELEKNIHCLQNLVTHSVILDRLPNDVKSELILVITRLFDTFMDAPKEISDLCWLNFLDILKSILSLMQLQDVTKVLRNIAKAVVEFQDDILNVHFARLMAECGKLSFPIGQNESALISKNFRALITSKQWLVHSEAFGALRRFAEVTPYTPVLEECVPDEMKEDFQKFICTIPYRSQDDEDQNAMLLRFLREQAMILRANKETENWETSIPVQDRIDCAEKELEKRKREETHGENDAKRTRVEIREILKEDEEILSSSLEELSKHLTILQEIRSRNSQFPADVWEKLKSMKATLDTLVKSE